MHSWQAEVLMPLDSIACNPRLTSAEPSRLMHVSSANVRQFVTRYLRWSISYAYHDARAVKVNMAGLGRLSVQPASVTSPKCLVTTA